MNLEPIILKPLPDDFELREVQEIATRAAVAYDEAGDSLLEVCKELKQVKEENERLKAGIRTDTGVDL